jgi:hypothetical protein
MNDARTLNTFVNEEVWSGFKFFNIYLKSLRFFLYLRALREHRITIK